MSIRKNYLEEMSSFPFCLRWMKSLLYLVLCVFDVEK